MQFGCDFEDAVICNERICNVSVFYRIAGRWLIGPFIGASAGSATINPIAQKYLYYEHVTYLRIASKMTSHRFGRDAWTERKLEALREYLQQWRLIFDKNTGAKYYKTLYIDAFAGTGSRQEPIKSANPDQLGLFESDPNLSADNYRRGSARIALELDSKFDEYVFVDKNPAHAAELRHMIKSDFPSLVSRCRVWEADGCEVMRQLCHYMKDWKKWRAVAFLDPYGMNVEWSLLEWIAKTKGIDLWLLWPLGMGANRLLTRDKKPHKAFADKLTRVFGSVDWEQFYTRPATLDLFDEAPASEIKHTDFEAIGNFYLRRLGTIFAGVASRTAVLSNSRGNPMYLLFFAAGNPKGAPTAVRIANYLMAE